MLIRTFIQSSLHFVLLFTHLYIHSQPRAADPARAASFNTILVCVYVLEYIWSVFSFVTFCVKYLQVCVCSFLQWSRPQGTCTPLHVHCSVRVEAGTFSRIISPVTHQGRVLEFGFVIFPFLMLTRNQTITSIFCAFVWLMKRHLLKHNYFKWMFDVYWYRYIKLLGSCFFSLFKLFRH